jgi:hypothetical protein
MHVIDKMTASAKVAVLPVLHPPLMLPVWHPCEPASDALKKKGKVINHYS